MQAGAVVQSNVAPYHHFIVLTSPNEADEVLFCHLFRCPSFSV